MTEIDRYGHEIERVRPERPAQPRPLTRDELQEVVDAVVVYTKIPPDRSMIQLWAVQSELGRWTAAEAIRAIHLWGRDRAKGEFLEPADVTRSIRASRQDEAMRAEQKWLAENPGNPATAERVQQIIGELAQTMGWTDKNVGRESYALRVACPHCGVRSGARCVSRTTGQPLKESACHPSRADALADELRGEAS